MDRSAGPRLLAAAAVATALAVSAGCLGAAGGGPAGTTDANVALEPGGTATVDVVATDVFELQFSLRNRTAIPERERPVVDYGNVSFSPAMSGGVDTAEPVWIWESVPDRVVGEIPVGAPDDADPGTYRYDLEVLHDHEQGEETTRTVVVRIVPGDDGA